MRQKVPDTNELPKISDSITPQRYTQERDDTFSTIGGTKMDFLFLFWGGVKGGGNFRKHSFFLGYTSVSRTTKPVSDSVLKYRKGKKVTICLL